MDPPKPKKSPLENLSIVIVILSLIAAIPVAFAALPMGLSVFTIPAMILIGFIVNSEFKKSSNPIGLALLLSPFLLTAALVAIALIYPFPSHPTPDYLSELQRESLIKSVSTLFYMNFAWLAITPILYPGRKWMALANSLGIAVLHIGIFFLTTMTVSGVWL